MPAQLPIAFRLFMPGVWLLAIASAPAWALTSEVQSWPAVIGLVLFGNVADRFAVDVRKGMRVSTAHFVAAFAIVADSVTGGLITAAGCLLGRLVAGRATFNAFDMAINVTAASAVGLVWHLGWNPLMGDIGPTATVFAFAATVLLFTLVRGSLTQTWAAMGRRQGLDIPRDASRSIAMLMTAASLVFTPALGFVVNQRDEDRWVWAVLLVPFLATQFLLGSFRRDREALETERKLNLSLERANVSLTESLVTALDARDRYTAGHSIAVAVYGRDIAVRLGLPADEVATIYLAGLLHDVGKIAVPDHILSKPGKLTDEEFAEIKMHPQVGEAILKPADHYAAILPGVRHHHERIDGRGYPDGLQGEDIPLQARILAVADAYNAMTSDRPYRQGMEPVTACHILREHEGKQHDAQILAAFQQVLNAKDAAYARGLGPEFALSDTMRDLLDLNRAPAQLRPVAGANQPESDRPGDEKAA